MRDWSQQQACGGASESAAPEEDFTGMLQPVFLGHVDRPNGTHFTIAAFAGSQDKALIGIANQLRRGADVRYQSLMGRPAFRVADRSDPFLQGQGLRPAETVPQARIGFLQELAGKP